MCIFIRIFSVECHSRSFSVTAIVAISLSFRAFSEYLLLARLFQHWMKSFQLTWIWHQFSLWIRQYCKQSMSTIHSRHSVSFSCSEMMCHVSFLFQKLLTKFFCGTLEQYLIIWTATLKGTKEEEKHCLRVYICYNRIALFVFIRTFSLK